LYLKPVLHFYVNRMINRPRFRVRHCTYKNLVFNVVCYFITLEYEIITIRLEGTQSCLLFIRVMLKKDQKKKLKEQF
jgi:hypothetical protein